MEWSTCNDHEESFRSEADSFDIMAMDSNGDLVVIEVKVSRGYDTAVGQLRTGSIKLRKNERAFWAL